MVCLGLSVPIEEVFDWKFLLFFEWCVELVSSYLIAKATWN